MSEALSRTVSGEAAASEGVPASLSEVVLLSADQGVLTVTINRPRSRNAVDRATSAALGAAFSLFESREDLTAAVLTGAGGTFSAGMDLKAFLRGEDARVAPRGFAGLIWQQPTKPLIAAVEGHCLAGGFEIALACDMIVAAEDARFGLPEVRRGLTANGGGLIRLARRLPTAQAMELVLTGDDISARRAYELGLVNRVVPAGSTLDAALALARRVAANGPLAVTVSKKVLTESTEWPVAEAFSRQEVLVAPVRQSDDAKEGARAFAEKRPPVWHGR
ncbi:crotonase/enoyl-CoA hydratase family protein [Parafrankia elaeagni]|uniref:crotonase/enoyl-CoA hydratase family protein n=1 Tax=Parafrankia elaeagni TaxID=222534 RepID=UPI0003674FD6|nr:crotonase/enoyl-CoA hydratase family protein [Parafrankia elaeagni]